MFAFRPWRIPSDEESGWQVADCIRCCEAVRVDEEGYCRRCRWAVRAEVEQGLCALRDYLRAWSLFMDWCAQRGQRIA